MDKTNQTLGEFIIKNQKDFSYSSGELSRIFNSIRLVAKVVSYNVNKSGLVEITFTVMHERAPSFCGSLNIVQEARRMQASPKTY
jgi:fructose-1,6-bisphosphatase